MPVTHQPCPEWRNAMKSMLYLLEYFPKKPKALLHQKMTLVTPYSPQIHDFSFTSFCKKDVLYHGKYGLSMVLWETLKTTISSSHNTFFVCINLMKGQSCARWDVWDTATNDSYWFQTADMTPHWLTVHFKMFDGDIYQIVWAKTVSPGRPFQKELGEPSCMVSKDVNIILDFFMFHLFRWICFLSVYGCVNGVIYFLHECFNRT